MDCSNARLFLFFNTPAGADLAGPEAEELRRHLAQCSECHALAGAEQRLDQHLGRAMRDVAIPDGLRGRILQRVAAERGEWNRRWAAHAARAVAGIAALVLVCVGVWWWWTKPPSRIDAHEVAKAMSVYPVRDARAVNEQLVGLQGWEVPKDGRGAPTDVNYSYLTGAPALAILPGYDKVKAPQLVFTRAVPTRSGVVEQKAVIFIINDKEFTVVEEQPQDDSGYQYRVEVYKPPSSSYTYLVLYTGNSWAWLKAPAAE
jgi:hypothetical protein